MATQYTITLNDDGTVDLPRGRSDVAEWCMTHNKYLRVFVGTPPAPPEAQTPTEDTGHAGSLPPFFDDSGYASSRA